MRKSFPTILHVSCRAYFRQLYVGQDAADGGAAAMEAPGDLGFADAGTMKISDLWFFLRRGRWAAQFRSFEAGLDESGANALSQNFVFELCEDRQQPRHR